jgi:hypothetical protein
MENLAGLFAAGQLFAELLDEMVAQPAGRGKL